MNWRPMEAEPDDPKKTPYFGSPRRWITIDGETQPIQYWVRLYGVGRTTIYERLRQGWDLELAVTLPTRRYRKRKDADGEERTQEPDQRQALQGRGVEGIQGPARGAEAQRLLGPQGLEGRALDVSPERRLAPGG